jgi:hypothetical protein
MHVTTEVHNGFSQRCADELELSVKLRVANSALLRGKTKIHHKKSDRQAHRSKKSEIENQKILNL